MHSNLFSSQPTFTVCAGMSQPTFKFLIADLFSSKYSLSTNDAVFQAYYQTLYIHLSQPEILEIKKE